ncbi:MAG: hypothetical protein JWO26_700, partial [Rhodospirillales bacterium]|nr:hypothetical protein [Rhodospirillales bacterium]
VFAEMFIRTRNQHGVDSGSVEAGAKVGKALGNGHGGGVLTGCYHSFACRHRKPCNIAVALLLHCRID